MPKTESRNIDATYAFNITFTRADESHAHVYECGYNAYGLGIDSVEAGEALVRERLDHLTLISVEHFATITFDGDVTYAKDHKVEIVRNERIEEREGSDGRIHQATIVTWDVVSAGELLRECDTLNAATLFVASL